MQQIPGLDPTPWTAYGVLGILIPVIALLTTIVWRLVHSFSDAISKRDVTFMEFIEKQRTESSTSVEKISNMVKESYDKLSVIMGQQVRAMDRVLLANNVAAQIESRLGKHPNAPTSQEIETLIRQVLSEQRNQ